MRFLRAPAISIAVLLLAWGCFGPRAASAMTISPPYFEFTANPGDEILDVIHVTNENSFPIILTPKVVNFTSTPGDETSGAPSFYEDGPDARGMMSWVGVGSGEAMTLQPGALSNVPLSIRVPADAPPGGHFAAVLLQTPDSGSTPGQPSVGVRAGAGPLIFLRVNGDVREDLSIERFSGDRTVYQRLPVDLFLRVRNEGTVNMRPAGNVFIKDMFGRQVASIPVNEQHRAILPGSARRFDLSWARRRVNERDSEFLRQWKHFALGRYSASAVLVYGENRMQSAEYTFWVVPWMILLTGAGGIAAALLALRLLIRVYNRMVIRRHERAKPGNKDL